MENMKEKREGSIQFLVENEKTFEETSSPPISFSMVYWAGFLFQLENNVILPTIWNFVRQHFDSSIIMYGAILSVAAVAETLGAVILGFWSDRKPMFQPILAALFLFILGNVVYIGAWELNVWVVMVARFIAGLGFGGASIVLAYITHHSSSEQRNGKIAYYWLTCLSANIFGPLVTYLINLVHKNFGPHDFFINEMTLPAVFNILFYVASMVFMYVKWPAYATHHSSKSKRMGSSVQGFWKLAKTLSLLAIVCLYIKLVFSLLVSVFQAIASPITDQDTSGNSLIFIAIGALILFGVFLAKLINRCVSDYNTLQIGQVMAFISLFGLLHWGIKDKDLSAGIFGIASIILTLGNSIGITVCTIAFSKAIGQKNPDKGVLMGWFITAAAGGRILGPILSCIGLETLGLNVVGGVLIGMTLVAMAALFFCRLRMRYLQIYDEVDG